MQKDTLVRFLRYRNHLFSIAMLALACAGALAQDKAIPVADAAAQGAPAMPTDSRELLQLAAESNGLTGAGVQPWHLKVSYTALDESGIATGQGTFEELWAAPRKDKTTYSSAGFTQTNYRTDKGLYRTGAQTFPPAPLGRAASEFSSPFFSSVSGPSGAAAAAFLQAWILGKEEKRNQNGMKLRCVDVKGWTSAAGTRPMNGPTFCFEADRPILRSSSNPMDSTEWALSNILSFQGRYIAGDIEEIRNGKPILKAHLENIELLKTVDEAEFAPPADAVLVPLKVNISGGVAAAMLVQRTVPEYPIEAKQGGISGTVVLQATIGKDGHVTDVQPMSGPPELRQAALDAVRTWVYKPYLLNGDPVIVNTTVNVVFTLGN
jgi:TonB family protein